MEDSLHIFLFDDDDNSDGYKKLNPVIVEDASVLLLIEHDITDDLFNVLKRSIALLSDNIFALIFVIGNVEQRKLYHKASQMDGE